MLRMYTILLVACLMVATTGCARRWPSTPLTPCPGSAAGPAAGEEAFLAMLLALKERKYEILHADVAKRQVTARYSLGYRGSFYNVTWLIQVHPSGKLQVDTQRQRHRGKQIKHVRKWFRNLERSYDEQRCKPLPLLRYEVWSQGIVRMPQPAPPTWVPAPAPPPTTP